MIDHAHGPDRRQAPVYFDNNATTALRPEARDELLRHLDRPGNASSAHSDGARSANAVAAARERVAALVGCLPNEVIFTSGATEALNIGLRACVRARSGGLAISAVEHPAVLETAQALAQTQAERLTLLPVRPDGLLANEVGELLSSRRPSVISVMRANNETGVIQDMSTVADLATSFGSILHSDLTQAVGKIPVDLSQLRVDVAAFSAHKFGGPQGVGILVVRQRSGLSADPLVHGGQHERGWRPGTMNVAGIAAAGAAALAAKSSLEDEARRLTGLSAQIEVALRQIPGALVLGQDAPRLPGTINIAFAGAPAEAVILRLADQVSVSHGSACSSGSWGPSHVLTAMGVPEEFAEGAIRISLGWNSTQRDVDRAVPRIIRAIAEIRELTEWKIDDLSPVF